MVTDIAAGLMQSLAEKEVAEEFVFVAGALGFWPPVVHFGQYPPSSAKAGSIHQVTENMPCVIQVPFGTFWCVAFKDSIGCVTPEGDYRIFKEPFGGIRAVFSSKKTCGSFEGTYAITGPIKNEIAGETLDENGVARFMVADGEGDFENLLILMGLE